MNVGKTFKIIKKIFNGIIHIANKRLILLLQIHSQMNSNIDTHNIVHIFNATRFAYKRWMDTE